MKKQRPLEIVSMSAAQSAPTASARGGDEERTGRRAFEGYVWTSLIPGLLGLLLWLHAISGALEFEVATAGTRASVVFVYVMPLGILGASLLLRRGFFALLLFPISMVPALALQKPLDLRLLNTREGSLVLAGGLMLYLVAAARFGGRRETPEVIVGEVLDREVSVAFWGVVRYMAPRALLLAIVLVGPLWALHSEGGQAQLREGFEGKALDARFLIHTVHLFISMIVAYLLFLSPSVNLSLELYELRGELKKIRQARQRRRSVMLAIAAGVIACILFITLLILT